MVIALVDFYVWKGIGAIITGQRARSLARGIHIFSMVVTLTGIIGTWITFSAGLSNMGLFTNLIMGLTFSFFVAKVVFVSFLLMEDIFRGGSYLVQKTGNLVNPESAAAELPSRRKFIGQLGLVMAAIPFSSLMYGVLKGKYDFKLHKITLKFPDLPEAFNGMTIAQISDIHSGSFDSIAGVKSGVDLVQKQNPDMILFTGDLVNNVAEEIDPYIELFKGLNAPLGKYSVLGNHDYGEYYDWPSQAAKDQNLEGVKGKHGDMGFRLLNNENLTIERNGQKIRLAGVENWGKPPFPQYGDLDKALEGVDGDDFTILMSHDPNHWDAKVLPHPKKIHLTLSGHTHGAQMGVEIPGFRWTPVQYFYKRWLGLYKEKDQYAYVNRGFGYIGYPGRFGIWPEVTLFELKRA